MINEEKHQFGTATIEAGEGTWPVFEKLDPKVQTKWRKKVQKRESFVIPPIAQMESFVTKICYAIALVVLFVIVFAVLSLLSV